jgi:hypothetical protein
MVDCWANPQICRNCEVFRTLFRHFQIARSTPQKGVVGQNSIANHVLRMVYNRGTCAAHGRSEAVETKHSV